MLAAINDLSFRYQMSSLEEAIERLELFSDLCKKIETGYMTNIEKIVIAQEHDYTTPLAPHYVLQQIIRRISPREKQQYLISLLINRDSFPEQEDVSPFCLDNNESYLCAYAKNDVVVSLFSNAIFEPPILTGACGGSSISIHNLSQIGHIQIHEGYLGIRHYHANSVKHKPNRINAYGGKKPASPMDLDDATAQELLNRAVSINHRLYAQKAGKIYVFMAEAPCVYHGYLEENAPEHVKRQLEKLPWD